MPEAIDSFLLQIGDMVHLTPLLREGVCRTTSDFAAFVDPLTVKYIEMFYADFSYLSIY